MPPAALRDPTGILARAPELEALAYRVPAVRRAIEQGRPLDAYRALYWANRLRRLGDQGAVAATLLARRRVFLKALTTVPRMFTYNGVGTSLYGRADLDINDGSYVATLFVVVFFIPVFPIASYLARDGQASRRRSWNIMAKVPMGSLTYFWQRAVALGVIALILAASSSAIDEYGHATLHVVNGLDRPVSVELRGATARATVLPGEQTPIRTTVGKHQLDIRDGDRVIESSVVDLPRGRSAVAWNVLGAAPLYVDHETYSKDGASPSDNAPTPQVLCGQSLIVGKDVDYVFSTPPKELSLPSGSSSVVKTHMGIAPGGWRSCINYLASLGGLAKGAWLTLQLARATRATAAAMGPEIDSALAVLPTAEAEAFAKDLLTRDDTLEANRIYQNVLLESHQQARASAEYDARLAVKPGADSEYLALRVRPEDQQRKTVDAVVARFPEHAYLRRAQALTHYADLEFPATASACDALKELDPKLWLESIDQCVDGFVGVGRGQDALGTLRGVAADSSMTSSNRRDAAILAFRVAHRIGEAAPDVASGDDEDPAATHLFVLAVTGIPIEPAAIEKVKDEPMREALRISAAARSTPDAALARIREANAAALMRLPNAIHMLLFAEAIRRDDASDVAERLVPDGMPFIAYADFFMKTSVRISRAQELQADAVAAQVAGASAAAGALRKTEILSTAWQAYFHGEVLPILNKARLPPLLEGFDRYWRAAQTPGTPAFDALKSALDTSVRPDDTHPPLGERIAALGESRRCGRRDGRCARLAR